MGELILVKTNTALSNIQEQYFYYGLKDKEYKVLQQLSDKTNQKKKRSKLF